MTTSIIDRLQVTKRQYGRYQVNTSCFGYYDVLAVANSPTKDAATPLMYAAMSGRFNLVEILLEYGADINAKDNESGWTALMQGISFITYRQSVKKCQKVSFQVTKFRPKMIKILTPRKMYKL